MKRIAILLDRIIQIVSSITVIFICLFPVLFFGRPILDFMGVLSYAPPLNQDPENILYIELTDTTNPLEPIVLCTLSDSEKDAFLSDFLSMKVKRYSNDPPTSYGDKLIEIYYADGHRDRIGKVINEYLSPSGDSLPAGGWYYFPDDSMDTLFDKYLQ